MVNNQDRRPRITLWELIISCLIMTLQNFILCSVPAIMTVSGSIEVSGSRNWIVDVRNWIIVFLFPLIYMFPSAVMDDDFTFVAYRVMLPVTLFIVLIFKFSYMTNMILMFCLLLAWFLAVRIKSNEIEI